MKKIVFTVTLAFSYLVIFTNVAQAQNINYKIPNPSKYDSLEELINAAASLIRPIFLITFGAMVLYGAFLLTTARGDDTKVAKSKQTITAAIIGFTIAVLAPTIVNFVIGLIGAEGVGVL